MISGKSYSAMDSKNKQIEKDKGQNITVVVRCRPRNEMEQNMNSPNVIELNCEKKEVMVSGDNLLTAHFNAARSFIFDKVFDQRSKQIEVYKSVVCPILDEVLQGYSCTIFAYGQTGTGKTYTMEGCRSNDRYCYSWDQDPQSGMIPRSIHQLFEMLNRNQDISEFSVRVSFLEIYNEELFDLLGPPFEHQKLRIYDDTTRKGSVFVQGLEELIVHNKSEVYSILEKGAQRRQTAATLLNATSSRSHTVFSVTVNMKENNIQGEDILKTGKLYLVDLAGSENIGRSGAMDRRAREAGTINQSLLTLGRVISALVEKTPHIPYRESKLTRLLQDSLGGRTKTCIIATISPSAYNIEETISTLEYAQRAKHIQNRPEVNQLNKKGLIREYTEQLEKLKKDLIACRDKNGIYISEDNYGAMQSTLASQKDAIIELEDQLTATREQLDKITSLFETTQQTVGQQETEIKDAKTWLIWVRDELTSTRQRIHNKSRQIFERDLVNNELSKDQKILYDEATKLLKVARDDIRNIDILYSKVGQLRTNTRDTQSYIINYGKFLKHSIKTLLSDSNNLKKAQKKTKENSDSKISEFLNKSQLLFNLYIEWVDSFLLQSSNNISQIITQSDNLKRKSENSAMETCEKIKCVKDEMLTSFKAFGDGVLETNILKSTSFINDLKEYILNYLENNRVKMNCLNREIGKKNEEQKTRNIEFLNESLKTPIEPAIREIQTHAQLLTEKFPLWKSNLLNSVNNVIENSFQKIISETSESYTKINQISDTAISLINLKQERFVNFLNELNNNNDIIFQNIQKYDTDNSENMMSTSENLQQQCVLFFTYISTFSNSIATFRESFMNQILNSNTSISGSLVQFTNELHALLDLHKTSLISFEESIKSSKPQLLKYGQDNALETSESVGLLSSISENLYSIINESCDNSVGVLEGMLKQYKEEMNKCKFSYKSVGDTPNPRSSEPISSPPKPKNKEDIIATAHIMIDSNIINTPTPPRSKIAINNLKIINENVPIPAFPIDIINNENSKKSIEGHRENRESSTGVVKKQGL